MMIGLARSNHRTLPKGSTWLVCVKRKIDFEGSYRLEIGAYHKKAM